MTSAFAITILRIDERQRSPSIHVRIILTIMYTPCAYIVINNIICIYDIIMLILIYSEFFTYIVRPRRAKKSQPPHNMHRAIIVSMLFSTVYYYIICHIVGHPHNPRTRVSRFTTTITHTHIHTHIHTPFKRRYYYYYCYLFFRLRRPSGGKPLGIGCVTPLTAAFYVSAGPYNYYPPFYMQRTVGRRRAANATAIDVVRVR